MCQEYFVGWRLPHIGNCAVLSPVLSHVRLLFSFLCNLMWNTIHSNLSLCLNTSVVPFTRNLLAHLGVVQWGAQWECADPPSQPRRRGDHQPRQHAVRGRVRDPPAGNPVPEERSHLPPADPNPRPDYNGGEYERGRSQEDATFNFTAHPQHDSDRWMTTTTHWQLCGIVSIYISCSSAT